MNQLPVYRFDGFEVDPGAWRLSRDGQEVDLDPVVLRLLIYLIANKDRLVTRQELMDTVWGDTVISESAINQAVARLRKALGDHSANPRYLETVHSKGYRFIAEVAEAESPSLADPPAVNPPKTARHRVLAAGVAIVILLVLAVFWTGVPQRDTSQIEQIQSLAVLPLHNLTGDPEFAWEAYRRFVRMFAEIVFGVILGTGVGGGIVERGRLLVEGAGHCGECHTPRNLIGASIADRELAGAAATTASHPPAADNAHGNAIAKPTMSTMSWTRLTQAELKVMSSLRLCLR